MFTILSYSRLKVSVIQILNFLPSSKGDHLHPTVWKAISWHSLKR